MSPSNKIAQVPSPPLIVPPLRDHKTTLIILHGRGSTDEKFAEPLLKHIVSPLCTTTSSNTGSLQKTEPPKYFQDYFPDTRFVFPTAPLRRAPELKQHLQSQGLRETSAFLHDLLKEEIKTIGAKNVVSMGLSQGCAASIVSTLLWKGEPFGALVGMCGYLPFRKGMHDSVEEPEDEDDDASVRSDEDAEDMFEKAVGWLGEELGTCGSVSGEHDQPAMQSIPLFMGHGIDDEKVPCRIGKLAAEFLTTLDVSVTWKEYEGSGHWYSDDMLRDVVEFLENLEA
ncbi:esterase [Pyrenophora tritici-repentis]|uniref:Esterase n=1 Tax=Pyrenophora tritici-repentis TaxID=45151 RepID=A0A2W1DY56_9PLEO|nr:esterase [Pyrenophora tritici-repentis]KAG9383594.1 esterase [Pyrenophora tritici-repentis]KAI0569126.1 esterase [Pyrenophora tritici-repentis]KAI1508227.1 esterase [Pyrenophora tritici-repentis]KAI1523223.1 esterase [Pyrenophora tritici-repentis]